ncbi:MAG TPA: hypothetical protein VJ743_00295 [Albitalea sp.]|nr:hypothetical protein [Albitalea sp.]
MLRTLVAALLVLNLLFWAWTQGWLDDVVGARARGDREPERLARQVHPEMIRILTPQAVAAAARAAEMQLACLEAGPYDDAAIAAAEGALASTLPSGTWVRHTVEQPTRWIVYMGRYPNRDALQKKAQELARMHVAFEELRDAGGLEPGLSLGRFGERGAADAALAQWTQRGIQTAKVVELARSRSLHTLRVERADAELAAKVNALKLDALGKGFAACAKPS